MVYDPKRGYNPYESELTSLADGVYRLRNKLDTLPHPAAGPYVDDAAAEFQRTFPNVPIRTCVSLIELVTEPEILGKRKLEIPNFELFEVPHEDWPDDDLRNEVWLYERRAKHLIEYRENPDNHFAGRVKDAITVFAPYARLWLPQGVGMFSYHVPFDDEKLGEETLNALWPTWSGFHCTDWGKFVDLRFRNRDIPFELPSIKAPSGKRPKKYLSFSDLAPFPAMDLRYMYFPLNISQETRFSHTHVVGGTGSGKTTLLQNMIAYDLKSEAAVIVIEPHKALIASLEALKPSRPVTLIDPAAAPGINIFDVKQADDAVEREKTFASVVKMLSYLFREGDTPPTGKQMMVFQYLCRLMLSLDRPATLITLFEFLENPAPFQADIVRLPVIARSFFKDFTDPKSAEYRNTAGQLRYRLHTILSNPVLERIFSATKTEFRIGEEMENGSLVLIDADQSFLGDAHAVFGKIFLALIMEAARERGANSRPVFLYVDEAHRFLDEQANDLLTDARKFRVGCIFAHQNLGQIHSGEMRGALAGTATKFAGGIQAEDASSLARDMRTSPEFLMSLEKHHFAAFIKGETSTAVSISASPDPFAVFEKRDNVRRERPAPLRPVSPPAALPMSDEY